MKEEIEVLVQYNKGNARIVKITISNNVYNVVTTHPGRNKPGHNTYQIEGSGFSGIVEHEIDTNRWYMTEINNY